MVEPLVAAWTPLQGVALALALGLLIGTERGWSQRDERAGSRVAGLRTFALLGLAGGIAGEIAGVSMLLAVVIVAAAAATLVVGYFRTAAERDAASATTTVVGVITLGLGFLAATGEGVLAAAAAAVMTLVLALRRRLHAWVAAISEAEMHAIARFGLISLAVLPVLPDADFGPYGAWNPRKIWLVVVVVSGLSLAGYAASRRFGASKGLLATAAAGALVSSTAVTAALAARLRHEEGGGAVLAAGVAIASAVMLARVLVLVGLLIPFAIGPVAVLFAPALLTSILCAAWLLRRGRGETGGEAAQPPVRNPFDLVPALLLAGLVAVISVVGRWAMDRFGDQGLTVVLAISGFLDVDSAIITAANLAPGSLAPVTAGVALAAPVAANTLVKAGIVAGIARGPGLRAAVPLLLSIAAGVAAWPLLRLLFG